ncbi:MAG: hypothetical protein ACE5FY_07940, partial [Nitrospiria bacterium]
KTGMLAQSLGSLERIIEWAQKELVDNDEPIFGATERMALPDEVAIFKRGDHRDRALALHTMIRHLEPEKPEPLVVMTPLCQDRCRLH